MSLKLKRLEVLPVGRYIPTLSIIILIVLAISTSVSAQQINFGATLSGNDISTPVSTTATGTAKFNVDPQGNMAYEIDVKNIKGVIGAHISLQNGTDLAQVFNPYVEIAGKSEIPTGGVIGQLSKGVLTSSDLSGPLIGKNITQLTALLNNGSVYVEVRTQAHESGEIQGHVSSLNSTGK